MSLLDSLIYEEIVKKLLQINNFQKNCLRVIKADFFKYQSAKTYDLVFSSGFIKHFENTKNIITNHIDLLNENGILLINLSNLKGVNGLIQRVFDIKIQYS